MLGSILAAILCSLGATAGAATLDVRGRLTDAQGQPENGACLLRFHLYGPSSDAPKAWSEALYVPVENGIFRTVLGRNEPIPPESLPEGFRLGVETPKGTGWQVMATPVARQADAPPLPVAGKAPAPAEAARRVPAPAVKRSEPGDETERLKARVAALERQLKPEASREARARIYEVKPGDTLQSVAAKLWGDPSRWAELYNANAERIRRGGDLQPGQKLVLPDLGGRP